MAAAAVEYAERAPLSSWFVEGNRSYLAARSAAKAVAPNADDHVAKTMDAFSAAAYSDAEVFSESFSDAWALNAGTHASDLSQRPLWQISPPPHLAEAWRRLERGLLTSDQVWQVWTEWYQDRLDGKPFDKALEEARVLIPEEVWQQGAKAVNAEIARLIEEHAEERTPQAEHLVIVAETGRVGVRPAAIRDGDGFDNACDKVRDRLDDLLAKGNQDQYTAARPVTDDLERVFARYRDNPRRVHDSFAAGVWSLQLLIDATELPANDLLILNLQRDMAHAAIDIREAVPAVQQMVEARDRLRVTPPDRAALNVVDRLLVEEGDALEPPLAEEMREDTDALDAALDQGVDPNEPLPEGNLRDRAYRLGGRLVRLLRMARLPTADDVSKGLAAVDRLFDFLKKAKTWSELVKWLYRLVVGY